MPVKLTIQGINLVCKDTTAAAKIVDLIATTATPINSKYLDGELAREAHGDRWDVDYATKLTYRIEPMEHEAYASEEELDATVERINAVAKENAAIEE